MIISKAASLIVAVVLLATVAACGTSTGGGAPKAQSTSTVSSGTSSATTNEWCLANAAWNQTSLLVANSAQMQFRIVGIVDFKGKSYCKAEYTLDVPGQKSVYTYYFNVDSSDMWAVFDVNGQTQEIRVAGN